MNDIQTITVYFKIVYGIVAVVIAGYAWYLARAARRARASLVAGARRDQLG
jgi:hypothetical protein